MGPPPRYELGQWGSSRPSLSLSSASAVHGRCRSLQDPSSNPSLTLSRVTLGMSLSHFLSPMSIWGLNELM
jgi:hypothetical protein